MFYVIAVFSKKQIESPHRFLFGLDFFLVFRPTSCKKSKKCFFINKVQYGINF